MLAHPDERSHAGDKQRRVGSHPAPPHLGDVANLVDVDPGQDGRGKLPSPGRPVDAEGDEERRHGAELRQPEEEQLSLRQDGDEDELQLPKQQPGRAERSEDACPPAAGARAFAHLVERLLLERGGESVNPLADAFGLARALRQQRQRFSPQRRRTRGVLCLLGRSGLTRQHLQPFPVDQRVAGRTDQQRPRHLRTAGGAQDGCGFQHQLSHSGVRARRERRRTGRS
jgi:hypothetical protein